MKVSYFSVTFYVQSMYKVGRAPLQFSVFFCPVNNIELKLELSVASAFESIFVVGGAEISLNELSSVHIVKLFCTTYDLRSSTDHTIARYFFYVVSYLHFATDSDLDTYPIGFVVSSGSC